MSSKSIPQFTWDELDIIIKEFEFKHMNLHSVCPFSCNEKYKDIADKAREMQKKVK